MNLTCKPCGHTFRLDLQFPIPIDAFVKATKKASCPKCGAGPDKLGVGHPENPGGLK